MKIKCLPCESGNENLHVSRSFRKKHSEEHKTSNDSWRIKEADTKYVIIN